MTKLETLLEQRLGNAPSTKVKALAQQSSAGDLSSFAGLFRTQELTHLEKRTLENILLHHQREDEDIGQDLSLLTTLTAEVKAIHNQAALLHGERIHKVQALLKRYKDGAFTSWLYAAYGNRQTPYNFLLYYEFCQTLPPQLKQKADTMPRQAIYALASRKVANDKKQAFIASFAGETKKELLERIRTSFPLELEDKRRTSPEQPLIASLERMMTSFLRQEKDFSEESKEALRRSLRHFLRNI